MALSQTYSTHGTEAPLPRLVESICLTVVIAEAAFLVGSLLKGTWLIAPHGGWVESDFVDVWAAGRLALAGHAAMAYDWSIHKLAEDSAFGHRFDGYYAWYYPPTFCSSRPCWRHCLTRLLIWSGPLARSPSI